MSYPQELFRDVYWAFREPTFDVVNEFVSELKDYHKEITGGTLSLKFDEVVLSVPEVVIQYVKYSNDKGDIDEPQVKLTADNNKDFTTKELLFKIHNLVGINLFEDDNCFFEGLSYSTDDDPDFPGIPVYFLDTGT